MQHAPWHAGLAGDGTRFAVSHSRSQRCGRWLSPRREPFLCHSPSRPPSQKAPMALHPATTNGSRPGTEGDPAAERRQLVLLTAATGCVAAAGVAVPLVSSLAPSERARAMGAGVEVDISDLQSGG